MKNISNPLNVCPTCYGEGVICFVCDQTNSACFCDGDFEPIDCPDCDGSD